MDDRDHLAPAPRFLYRVADGLNHLHGREMKKSLRLGVL